jgi:hypothetical protein
MLSVARSPKAPRFTSFHSVSIAFNSGIARGNSRTSMPKWSAHPPYAEVPPPQGSVAHSVDKGHGRLERRTLRVTTILTRHQQGCRRVARPRKTCRLSGCH